MIHQTDSKNEWLLLSASFTAKIGLEGAFLRGFILKPTERAQVPLKNDARDFQNSPPFERLACFYVTIRGNFEKLESRFLVESTKIENTSFPYKTALSEANVKTNRMVSKKWTYYKERSFASDYFILLNTLFPFKSLL